MDESKVFAIIYKDEITGELKMKWITPSFIDKNDFDPINPKIQETNFFDKLRKDKII